MSRSDREFIQRQVIEAGHLAQLHGEGSFMAHAWQLRKASLEKELSDVRESIPAPRTVLFFAGGDAVLGSRGIDAAFVADILKPFQEMVKSQFATLRHGRIGRRGPRKNEDEARLFLTGLPRGSFGLELSQPLVEDWVQAQQLSNTLNRLTRAVEAAGKSDEDFANAIEEISPRVLPRLQEFLDVASKHGASMRIESGDLRCALSVEQVAQAKARAATTSTNSVPIVRRGTFRGATLDTWRFDFKPDDGPGFSGQIGDELSEDQVADMNRHTNAACEAKLIQTTITPPSGIVRVKFELVDIKPTSETRSAVLTSSE
jgi:hypothetical protein